MADRVKKMSYLSVSVPNRAGMGARILHSIREAEANLTAFSGFPDRGKAQVDFVADSLTRVRAVLKKHGLRPSKNKRVFWIHGADQIGAVHKHLQRLADQKINVVSTQAICAGKGRFGMILWVKPKDYARAAKALHAR